MYDDTLSDVENAEVVAKVREVTGLTEVRAILLLKSHGNDATRAINAFIDEGGDGFGSAELLEDDAGVRAPLQPKADTLVDSAEARALNRRALKRPRRTGAPAFDGFRNFAVEMDQQEQILANRSLAINPFAAGFSGLSKRMEDIFRPPMDIIFHGPFATACSVASLDGKWLMVNPQNPEEFVCQTLNRDVWSDPTIKSIIRANFIFWQVFVDSENGQAYNQFYPVDKYPYVAIIDPRTGELLKKWNFIDKAHFAEQLMDFLQRNDVEMIAGNTEPEDGDLKSNLLRIRSNTLGIEMGNLEKSPKKGKSSIETSESGTPILAKPVSAIKTGLGAKRRVATPSTSRPTSYVRRRWVVSSTVTSAEPTGSPPASPGSSPASSPSLELLYEKLPKKEDDSDSGSDLGNAGDAGTADPQALIRLCIHMPAAGRKIMSFLAGGKIKLLHEKLAMEGYPRKEYEYLLTFPNRKVCSKEAGQCTFAAFGIANNDTIYVSARV